MEEEGKGIGCLMDIPEAKASTWRCFLFHSEGPESSCLLVDLVGRRTSGKWERRWCLTDEWESVQGDMLQ